MNKQRAANTPFQGYVFAILISSAVAMAGCTTETADELASSEDSLGLGATPTSLATPAMTWLSRLPVHQSGERALAKLFAQGTADSVPIGSGAGFPVLFNMLPEANFLAAQLWGGKTFRVVSSETHPNGDPSVRLDNKIIRTPTGELVNVFDAYVTRSKIADLNIGTNQRGECIPAPVGALKPVHLSFLDDAVIIDDKPSIVLNYFEDKTLPIIRRILDEIREIDAENCKGLYLGRAHVRRCTSFNCGEVPSGLVDFPTRPVVETRYEWNFWTYFLLNFASADAKCDLGPVTERVERELKAEGLDASLPPPPSAK